MHCTRATLAVVLLSVACIRAQGSPTQSPADARTLEAFKQSVTQYALLHKRLESTIPKISVDAAPQAIDEHQLKLGQLMMGARRRAKHGDVFTFEAERLFRRL